MSKLPPNLRDYLPAHLKHLQHSKLFISFEHSVSSFRANKIVDERFIEALVQIMATEFEKACDRSPVNCISLNLADNSKLSNYRFDRGYWELVVPDMQVSVVDDHSSTVIFKERANVSIEGSGGGLRKGKRKSESMKRAHTRQVATDARRVSIKKQSDDENDEEGDEFSDEEWTP